MTTLNNGMKRLPLLMFALPACVSCAASRAQAARYLLQQAQNRHEGHLLRLYDRRTQQFLWKLAVDNVCSEPAWSADHQALAIFINQGVSLNANLLIWKAGQPLRFLPARDSSTGYLFDYWDGIRNIAWSPNKTRLLLRAFYSDGGEANSGQLLCYVLDRKRFYEGPKGVRRAVWIGSRQARYWRVSYARPWIKDPLKKLDWYELPPESKSSRLWHCP